MADVEVDVATIAGITAVPTILEVVCRTTGMGFAAVARVTEDRWIACGVRDEIAFGLQPGGELKVATTICNEIRASHEAVIINEVSLDPVYCGHPTPQMYGFQSYISMPIIRRDGTFFGTLCAIDPRPARLKSAEVIGMFKLFAELIAFHVEAHEMVATSEASASTYKQDGELREEFIAVLGHDLRNPLASISAGVRLLQKRPSDDRFASIIKLIQTSVDRMAGLIDNILDFARGRLGDGLATERKTEDNLFTTLEQVVDELRMAWPHRVIETGFALDHSVYCDRGRIAQLFSNLLANALTHGASNGPIRASASTSSSMFELVVANSGEPIPAALLPNLFKPFYRAKVRKSQQGLGLGLYIASEIARAHGGRLDVTSTAEETRFTLRMPVI